MIDYEKLKVKIKCWWNGHLAGKKNYIEGFGYYSECCRCKKQMDFVMNDGWSDYIKNRLIL